jgi:hypothetical protein
MVALLRGISACAEKLYPDSWVPPPEHAWKPSSVPAKTDDDAVPADAAALAPGTTEHLLYDDHWTASATALTLTMHAPTKAGVVVKPEHPWEPVIFAYNSLVKVSDTDYRIYYDAIGCVDATCTHGRGHRVVCVALSSDGLSNWTKPDLGLHEFNGSKHNNIVYFPEADGKDDGQTYTIFLDANPAALPEQKFVAFNDQVFHSADGFNFTLASPARHLTFSDTQQGGYWDESIGQYRLYFRTHNGGAAPCPGGAHSERSIGTLTTSDMAAADWGPADKASGEANATIFNVDSGDNACMDLYTNGAFKAADLYGIVPMMFLHCNPGGTQRQTSCAYKNKDKLCDSPNEPLTCAEALKLRPTAKPPDGAGCAAFGCANVDGKCSDGLCTTPSGPLCITKPVNGSDTDPANFPRKCDTNPATGKPDASDGPLEAQFAVSRDGVSFQRISRRPFVPRGRGKPRTDPHFPGQYTGVFDGEFDSASTTVAVGHYEVGDMSVMMEGGWQYTHGGIDFAVDAATAPNRHPPHTGGLSGGPVLSGLQLLTMGRHRFVSLHSSDDLGAGGAPPVVGVWTTKPLELPRCPAGHDLTLSLNAQSGTDGFVAPALQLQSGGTWLQGVPLVGNDVAHAVEWVDSSAAGPKDSSTKLPAAVQGMTATLVVQLRVADLFAFAFSCV